MLQWWVSHDSLGVICLTKPWGEQKLGRPELSQNTHCSHLVNTEDYAENDFAEIVHQQWLSAGSWEPCD